jgi:Skp family chaperone for outer membrane proteins
MNIRHFTLVTALLIGTFGFAQGLRIAFVNPDELLAAHPAGQAVIALLEQRDEELQPLAQELEALQFKATTAEGLTSDERARAQLLIRTLEQTSARYEEDIARVGEPARAAINAAIEAVAQANGFNLVLDGSVAGSTGIALIVYSDGTVPDITQEVIAQMNTQ